MFNLQFKILDSKSDKLNPRAEWIQIVLKVRVLVSLQVDIITNQENHPCFGRSDQGGELQRHLQETWTRPKGLIQ